MFRVRTQFLYDRPIKSTPTPPGALRPLSLKYIIHELMDVIFFECTYHPVTQAAGLSLRVAPRPSDSNLFCDAYERRPSPQLQRMKGSISETNGRAGGSISCKPDGELFPVRITPFCNVLLSQPSVSAGEIFNGASRTLPVRVDLLVMAFVLALGFFWW